MEQGWPYVNIHSCLCNYKNSGWKILLAGLSVLLSWNKKFDSVVICDIPDTCTSAAIESLVILLQQHRASCLVDVANGIRPNPIVIHLSYS